MPSGRARNNSSAGGGDVIAAQAVRYVAPETWNALVERHRGKGCDALAAFARALLDGKKSLRGVVGNLVGALLAALGRPRVEQVFAQELASRVPLPFGHEIALAARSLQARAVTPRVRARFLALGPLWDQPVWPLVAADRRRWTQLDISGRCHS